LFLIHFLDSSCFNHYDENLGKQFQNSMKLRKKIVTIQPGRLSYLSGKLSQNNLSQDNYL